MARLLTVLAVILALAIGLHMLYDHIPGDDPVRIQKNPDGSITISTLDGHVIERIPIPRPGIATLAQPPAPARATVSAPAEPAYRGGKLFLAGLAGLIVSIGFWLALTLVLMWAWKGCR